MARFASLAKMHSKPIKSSDTHGAEEQQPGHMSKRGGLWFLDFAKAQHKFAMVCLSPNIDLLKAALFTQTWTTAFR